VNRIEVSHFDAATAYLALNCNRNDDLRPYAYVTRDYGKTWTSIASDLPPTENINTIRQDLKNRNLLFAGTENGFFVSLDEGKSWRRFMTGLAYTRVDEVIVHPRDGDLVIGTYGRSVYVMDNITALQQTTPAVLAEAAHLYKPRNAVLWHRDARLGRQLPGSNQFRGANPAPGTALDYYLKDAIQGPVKITIADATSGKEFRQLQGAGAAGINRVQWNLRGNLPAAGAERPVAGTDDEEAGPRQAPQGPLAKPGSYRVTLTVNGKSYSQVVVVEKDAWSGELK
jgi:hypothetical protein